MTHLIYAFRKNSANTKSRHPMHIMKDLGITYQYATPQSMYDQWWFWNCKNIPEELPKSITRFSCDPMKYIGSGLSKDMAEQIRDYKGDENG